MSRPQKYGQGMWLEDATGQWVWFEAPQTAALTKGKGQRQRKGHRKGQDRTELGNGTYVGKRNCCGREGHPANVCEDKSKLETRGWGRQAPAAAAVEPQHSPEAPSQMKSSIEMGSSNHQNG